MTGTLVVEQAAQSIPYMENPFQELAPDEARTPNELGTFLQWAHSFAQPLDADFLSSLQSFTEWALQCRTLPAALEDGGDIIGRLDVALLMLNEQRQRLLDLQRDFSEQRQQVEANYTEAQVSKWLCENMPKAFIYANLLSKLRYDDTNNSSPQSELAAQ